MITIHRSEHGVIKYVEKEKRTMRTVRYFYFVRITAKNGAILSTSETFTTKNNCFVNIAAQARAFKKQVALVVDMTGKKPAFYILHLHGKKIVKTRRFSSIIPSYFK